MRAEAFYGAVPKGEAAAARGVEVGEQALVVRALRSIQGAGTEIFCFFIPGEFITQIAEISRVKRDENSPLQGFQRDEIRNHVKSIVEYLDQGAVLFPNAIILALNQAVQFKQARGRDPDGLMDVADMGTLTIPCNSQGEPVAWIVDGQQRSLALSRTRTKGLPVPVVAFFAPDLQTQREQFILVNKAKPLPTRLINELLPEVDTHLPRDLAVRKIPSELCNLLNRDPNSPFYKLIRRVSQESDDGGTVIDTALIEIVKRSIGSPLGALSQFKGLGSEPSDVAGMYRTLTLFWSAVREVFPHAWAKPPAASRLMHSAGLKAMGVLMDRVMARAASYPDPKDEVLRSLNAIAPHCRWTEGVWEGLGLKWDAIQNVSRHVRALTDQLIKLDYDANRQRPS